MQSRVKTRGKWSIIEHSPTKKIKVSGESKNETVKVNQTTKSEKESK